MLVLELRWRKKDDGRKGDRQSKYEERIHVKTLFPYVKYGNFQDLTLRPSFLYLENVSRTIQRFNERFFMYDQI